MRWKIQSASGILGIEIYYSEYDAQCAADIRNALVPWQGWQAVAILVK